MAAVLLELEVAVESDDDSMLLHRAPSQPGQDSKHYRIVHAKFTQ